MQSGKLKPAPKINWVFPCIGSNLKIVLVTPESLNFKLGTIIFILSD